MIPTNSSYKNKKMRRIRHHPERQVAALILAITATLPNAHGLSSVFKSTSSSSSSINRELQLNQKLSTGRTNDHQYLIETKSNNTRRRRTETRRWFLEDHHRHHLENVGESSSSTTPNITSSHVPLNALTFANIHYQSATTTNTPASSTLFTPLPAIKTFPPWLASLYLDDASTSPSSLQLAEKLNILKTNMSTRSHLSSKDIETVTQAMYQAVSTCCKPKSPADEAIKLSGVMDFLSILVEFMEMRRDSLVAAAFHYCSCLQARETQVYDSIVRPTRQQQHSKRMNSSTTTGHFSDFDSAFLQPLAASGIESYGVDTVRIALGAAKLKTSEAVANAILQTKPTTKVLQKEDAANLRSLLLTANSGGEWRSLAIRCAACLYRLRGLTSYRQSRLPLSSPLTLDENQVAREALYIYAPLAHRLGMHRLKTELEGSAFQVLYRRQYQAVNSLLDHRLDVSCKTNHRGIPITPPTSSHLFFADFMTSDQYLSTLSPSSKKEDSYGSAMKSVLEDITSSVKRMLQEDETLMEHVSEIKVTARVKEPYSLWQKMLKIHNRNMDANRGTSRKSNLSLQVHDAIALRVILSARKLSPNEDKDVTEGRERALCYYVKQLCMTNLSAMSAVGVGDKDFIENPKSNGYQSLHYSAKMRWHGEEWPFEVQIRSAAMHRVAEYGVAAHWDYKAKSRKIGVDDDTTKYSSSTSIEYLKSVQQNRMAESNLNSRNNEELNVNNLGDLGFSSLAEGDSELASTVDTPSYDIAPYQDYGYFIRTEQVRARAERLAPYIEALTAARSDLARERVFVFFYQPAQEFETDDEASLSGSILSLPSGARVMDALKEGERKTGVNLKKMWFRESNNKNVILRNGVLTSATHPLENGDVLTLWTPTVREDGQEVAG